MSYREITAKRVTPISFLSLISLKTCFTLVNNNIYWQKKVKLHIQGITQKFWEDNDWEKRKWVMV